MCRFYNTKKIPEIVKILVRDDERNQEIIINLQKRLNNAIWYVERELSQFTTYENYEILNTLLNILKGSDDNE